MQAGSSRSWALKSNQASMEAWAEIPLPTKLVSRRMEAMYLAMAWELKIRVVVPLDLVISNNGNLPVGLRDAAAKSVLISRSMPLYSAAINAAKARKEASGA